MVVHTQIHTQQEECCVYCEWESRSWIVLMYSTPIEADSGSCLFNSGSIHATRKRGSLYQKWGLWCNLNDRDRVEKGLINF